MDGKLRRKSTISGSSPHHLQVQFIHEGEALICGTTNGQVMLWETATADALQELTHGGTFVQSITCRRERSSYIATGSAARGQGTYIKVWRAKIDARADVPDTVAEIVRTVSVRC
ncbi:hypothetical protein C8Q80DRAFT_1113408 [Daedaleopsis nitida]|nr:hypothetical protein C8Q80DRAFT_1113408 [Daedaleopsis nitida]